MATFPSGIFTSTAVTPTTSASGATSHSDLHNRITSEINAIEATLGVNVQKLGGTTVADRLDAVDVLVATKASTAHAASHAYGGTDAITITQDQVTNLSTTLAGKASTSHKTTHGYGGADAISLDPRQIIQGGATNGQVLAWSTTSTAWTPTTISAGSSGLTGFRNLLHNGNFSVWQRGISVSVTAATPTYTADRWFVKSANNAVAVADPSTTRKSALKLSAASGGSADIVQRISAEDSYHLAGATSLTVSGVFTAPAGTITVSLYKPSGGTDNTWGTYGAARTQIGSTVTLTSSTARQTATFTGTTNNLVDATGLELVVTFSSVATAVTLSELQLEAGSTATTFERRPYSYELGICQKFYERISNPASGGGVFNLGMGAISSTGQLLIAMVPIQVSKRNSNPTLSYTGVFTAVGPSGSTTLANQNASATLTLINNATIKIVATTSGLSQTSGTVGFVNMSDQGYIEISADL